MRTETWDWVVAGGCWWRFDRYRVKDGYLRPVAGARIETYRPWAQYTGTKIRGDEWRPPYADFVNLREDLALPRQDAEKQIATWCARYGLLGLGLHQFRTVTLAPRWRRSPEMSPLLVPAQEHYVHTSTGWVSKRLFLRPERMESFLSAHPELEGALVPREVAPEAWARVGGLRQGLRSAELSVEPLQLTWSTFFPDVAREEAETFPYPAPLSEEFWRAYAEPWGDFVDGMQRLDEALWDLDHHKSGEVSRLDAERVEEGRGLLEALLAPAGVTVVPETDGSFSQQWVWGSLLNAFAMMALHDLTESRRVRRCDTCGRLFVSQHPLALYCSRVCRWKRQKQRQRGSGSSSRRVRRNAPGRRKGKS